VKASTAIGASLLTLRETQVLSGQGTNGFDFLAVNDVQAKGCFGAIQCVEAGSKIYHVTHKTPNGEEWEPLPDGTLEQVDEEPQIFHADMSGEEQGRPRIYEPMENFALTYASPVLQVAFHHANIHLGRGTFAKKRRYYVGVILQ
jgi:hypothetical protein